MIEFVPETGSTNADLLARLRAGEAMNEGHWLVADRQSAGRGRQGRTWLDAPGNFMGSTLVKVSPHDPSPASLSFLAALVVYEAIVSHLQRPDLLRLKWPNDVLVGYAKLAGILLEREEGHVVIGIGVNLASSPDLPDRFTGDLAAFGPVPARDQFARELAVQFALELVRWREFGMEPMLARWQALGHRPGNVLRVHEGAGKTVTGEYLGLDADGGLRLRLADGTERVIHAGDVVQDRV